MWVYYEGVKKPIKLITHETNGSNFVHRLMKSKHGLYYTLCKREGEYTNPIDCSLLKFNPENAIHETVITSDVFFNHQIPSFVEYEETLYFKAMNSLISYNESNGDIQQIPTEYSLPSYPSPGITMHDELIFFTARLNNRAHLVEFNTQTKSFKSHMSSRSIGTPYLFKDKIYFSSNFGSGSESQIWSYDKNAQKREEIVKYALTYPTATPC